MPDNTPATPSVGDLAKSIADIGDKIVTKEEVGALKQRLDNLEAENKKLKADIKVGNPRGLPQDVPLFTSIKSFKGTEAEKKEKAYRWGAMALGGLFKNQKYVDQLKEHWGLELRKDALESVNTNAAIWVPDQMLNDIIDLREQYGVFRANARVIPMASDTLDVPRRTSGLTSYYKGEGAAYTESNKGWDTVSLTARKLTALAQYSNELNEDAIISIGDDLAQEMAYEFSYQEDLAGFIGDSTSTYGGIYGISPKLKATVGATTTSAGGVVVAAGNTIAEVTLANYHEVVGALPMYADMGNAKWYVSRYVWANSMERLARAAGGVTAMEIEGSWAKTFMGYPVVISQVLPKTDTTSQVICLFGDIRKSSIMGQRRGVTVSVSDQVGWSNDLISIKASQRFDIKVHDVGTATVAGPVIALQALNS